MLVLRMLVLLLLMLLLMPVRFRTAPRTDQAPSVCYPLCKFALAHLGGDVARATAARRRVRTARTDGG